MDTFWGANGTPSTTYVDNQLRSDTTFDTLGNMTLLKEYDFGGVLVRTTEISYEAGSEYAARNIRNRAKQVLVREGDQTGPIKSKTLITYDEPAYLHTVDPASDCPLGVVQHDDANYGCSMYFRGNPTTVTAYENAAAGTGAIARHTYYDFFGNVRKAEVNCCQQKEFIYSSANAFAFATEVRHGPAGPSQLVTSAAYNAYTGQVTSITSANGKTTTYTYELPMKRLSVVIRPDTATTNYSYDDAQRVVTVDLPLDGTNKIRQVTRFDPLGRPFQNEVTSTAGGDCSATKVEFDNMGRPYRQSNPFTCSYGPTYWTTTAFDPLGRATSVTAPDNAATTYIYSGASGSTLTATDPAGKQRKSETDALGRLRKVWEPDVNAGNALTQETTNDYNVLGLLTQVTQGVQTRTYTYDDLGRVLTVAVPETKHLGVQQFQSYQYNAFKLVTQKTDARGIITNYTYDSLNRLQTVSYNVGATGVPPAPSVTYTYGTDPAQNNKGRLVSVFSDAALTADDVTETFTYDLLGRATQVAKNIAGITYTVGYAYNLAGETTSITYPSGRVVTQSYDSHGRFQGISTPAYTGNLGTSNYAYDYAGQVTGFEYSNGVTAGFAYTPDRLQLAWMGYTKNGQNLMGSMFYYKYEPLYCPNGSTGNNGQIQCIRDISDTGITPGAEGRSLNYQYDALGRLKTAWTNGSASFPQWGLSWSYDRYGNRFEQMLLSGSAPTNYLTMDPGSNRILDTGFAYDANGNMTQDGANNLVYDAANRVVSTTPLGGGTTYNYVYDGAGLRVKKNTTATVQIYSGTKIIADYAVGAAPVSPLKEHFYSAGQWVATDHKQISVIDYRYSDYLGSARMTADSNGTVTGQQGHYPFGDSTLWYNSGTGGGRFIYTGYEYDGESGNHYALMRYDVGRLGRFSSPDPIAGPIADPQSLNRFTYASNDPINLVDPLGLFPSPRPIPEFPKGCVIYNLVAFLRGDGGLFCVQQHKRGERDPRREKIKEAIHKARLLLSDKKCAEFLKTLMAKLGVKATLDDFLKGFDSLEFVPTPKDDKNALSWSTAHVDDFGASNVIHVDKPADPALPQVMLHENFHSINFGISDLRLALLTTGIAQEPGLGVSEEQALKANSNAASKAFSQNCIPK